MIDCRTTLSELFDAWIPAKVAEDRIGERTVTLSRDTWLHGEQQLGALRIGELKTSRADAYLKTLPSSSATYLRIVLVGMYGLAARFDVVKHNPMRETRTAKTARKAPRALTAMQFDQVRQAVKAFCDYSVPGPRRGRMLPAFVELLAATGARPGEVLGIRWDDVDLLGDPPTVTVSGTVVEQRPRRRQVVALAVRAQGWRTAAHGEPARVRGPRARRSVRGDRSGGDGAEEPRRRPVKSVEHPVVAAGGARPA